MADDVDRHVVAGKYLVIGVDAEQLDRTGDLDASLLVELAQERCLDRLGELDTAARQQPAAGIGLPDQQNAAFAVDDDAARSGAAVTATFSATPPSSSGAKPRTSVRRAPG